jgi:hypothetical protein
VNLRRHPDTAKLEPLALVGDEAAQRLMKLITEKHGPGSDSWHSLVAVLNSEQN